jgi:hypothetical protein
MKVRKHYKGFVIEAISLERSDGGGWAARGSIEERDDLGVDDSPFEVLGTFESENAAIEAAIQFGKRGIDTGSAVGRSAETLRHG